MQPEQPESRQLELLREAFEDDGGPFVGLMVSDWSAARAWENVPTGEYL